MRISAALVLILCLAGCNRGNQSNDAVRRGVVEHLQKVGLNIGGMDVNIVSVQFNGKQADATVSIAPKGNAAGGMSMAYHLEQQGGNWVVTGRGRDSSGMPHGGGAMPQGKNPHAGTGSPQGGGTGAPGGSGMMPSPQDLPPAGKKR